MKFEDLKVCMTVRITYQGSTDYAVSTIGQITKDNHALSPEGALLATDWMIEEKIMSLEEMPALSVSFSREDIASVVGTDNVDNWLDNNESAFIDRMNELFYSVVRDLNY